MKMNKTQKYILFIFIGFFLIGGVVFVYFFKNDLDTIAEQYETHKVTRGTLSQTIIATGAVKEEAKLLLSFPFSGKIKKVFVDEGIEVEKGAPLVQLEESEFQFAKEKAQIALDLAMAELNQKRAPASDETKRVAEEEVEKTRVSVLLAKDQVASLEKQREALLTNMEEKQQRTKTETESNRTQLESATKASGLVLQGNFVALDKVLWDIDHILGVEKIGENDAFEALLKAGGANQFNEAQEKYIIAVSSRDKARASFLTLENNFSPTSLGGLFFLGEDALKTASHALSETRLVLQTAVAGSGLGTTELNVMKTTVDTDRTNINLETQSLETSKEKLENAKNALLVSEALFNELESSQQLELVSLDKEILNAKNNVTVAEQSLSLAQANKDATLALPRDIDLAPFEVKVKSAGTVLNESKKQLANSLLIAPGGGVVSEILVDPGEQITAGMEVISILAKGQFFVEAEIPESDISKINIAQDLILTLDAYPGEEFSGQVVSVASDALLRDGVVYYVVDISFDSLGKRVRPHMTTNVTLIVGEKKDVFFVPKRSIREEKGKKFIRILLSNRVEEKEIITGFLGNDGLIEVKEGLEEDQEVIIFDRSEKTTKF